VNFKDIKKTLSRLWDELDSERALAEERMERLDEAIGAAENLQNHMENLEETM
jgi:hypothetical protein